ncbi:MAG TPA: TonB family protein, partial [Polyangiaceae bacterium]
MDFGSWTERRIDTQRVRRLVVGWIVGSISVVAGMSFIVLTSTGVAASEEEDDGPIEVQLAKEPEPEPPPPPPPPPEAAKAAPKPRVAVPTTISDEKLQEKEPPKDLLAEEKMEEAPKEEPKPVVSAAPAPAPTPVVRQKPVEKKAIRLTEDMPKPQRLSGSTMPEYPPDVKSAGVEGVVIVRYVIGEDGSVRDVKALKGPTELHAASVATVKTWRFKPTVVDGSP